MARKIVVTSGKGGAGKTTVTANLGIFLAKTGARVVLVDVDFGLNNLDVVMGVENKIVYDVADILDGRCRVKQALVQDNGHKNLFVLPSGSLTASSPVSGQQLKLITESLSELFDYVILDCPAGLDCGFHRAVACADEAVVVTTPNLPSLRDADKAVTILKSYRLNKISLVVNRARGDLIMSDKMLFPKDIESLLKIPLIGVLPEEDAVFLSSGYTLPKSCDSYKAYKILANNLHKNSGKIYDVTAKYSGFFGSIRRSIKRSV
ncbi:MAG: septum site-determining protein MinD [Clostridia bacterium]|nr:septum site-determining protein MinD [Clostridia bacterium]